MKKGVVMFKKNLSKEQQTLSANMEKGQTLSTNSISKSMKPFAVLLRRQK
jgi:hypothetical protein